MPEVVYDSVDILHDNIYVTNKSQIESKHRMNER